MLAKIFFVVAAIIQAINAQYINGAYPGYPNGVATEAALANAYAIPNPVYDLQRPKAANGGTFVVQSSSPLAPNGVNVQSDNLLVEGPLAVSGQLPFLGVVSLEGPLPAAGSGTVSYNCGNGNVGIVNENEAIANAALGNTYGNAAVSNAAYGNAAISNAAYANAGISNAGYANAVNANNGYGNTGYAGIPNAGYINAGVVNAGIPNSGITNTITGARIY